MKLILTVLVSLMLLAPVVGADVFYPVLSGDAVYGEGADTINVNELFHIDINYEFYNLYLGFSTPFALYGTDSVTTLSYQAVYLGDIFYEIPGIPIPPDFIHYESWDGNLPDKFGVNVVTLSGFTGSGHYISLDLEISGDETSTGLFCIDSTDMINDDYDWIFNPSFPYFEHTCWPVYKFPDICGDVNTDGPVNILDIAKLGGILYMGEPPLHDMYKADVNHDCLINIVDITHLIDYLYYNGPPPDCPEEWPCK